MTVGPPQTLAGGPEQNSEMGPQLLLYIKIKANCTVCPGPLRSWAMDKLPQLPNSLGALRCHVIKPSLYPRCT